MFVVFLYVVSCVLVVVEFCVVCFVFRFANCNGFLFFCYVFCACCLVCLICVCVFVLFFGVLCSVLCVCFFVGRCWCFK